MLVRCSMLCAMVPGIWYVDNDIVDMMGMAGVKVRENELACYRGIVQVQAEEKCGDRVGWNREQALCFHPADPSVVEVETQEDTQ